MLYLPCENAVNLGGVMDVDSSFDLAGEPRKQTYNSPGLREPERGP